MRGYVVGDKVWWKDNAFRITRIWDTNCEGLRADLESLEHPGAVRASTQLSDLEGRLIEESVDSRHDS